MKLDVAVNEIVLSNVGTTGEFKIRNSAKAFKILSDGLYSNKIRAIIRELSCNALDSHVAAGKADLPFEVHLPSMLEPWFSVRDFGVGLDAYQVINIYTTYFESTKTDSNDFIGALGLGSKSPFSYTENFTVTAIKDGFKRIYSAFINEQGVPSIAEMNEELTDEGNGVEVKFSVSDKYDYNTFANEAQYVFSWFEHKPTILGVNVFQHRIISYKEKDIVPGVHVRDDGQNSCMATMGNIPYPLNNIPEANKHFGELAPLLECGLVLEFEIGELDFAASREQLSYIPLTIGNIRKKLEALNANLSIHLANKANAITNEWERAFYLFEQNQTRLYKAAVLKYVADTKFSLFDVKGYYGKKEFKFQVTDLLNRGLTIQGMRIRNAKSSKLGEGRDYINGNYVQHMSIPVEKDVVIVLNDLKTGCRSRALYHYTNHNNNKYVTLFCISHGDVNPAVRQVEYDKFISELHNPPIVVKASSLEKRKSTREKVSSNGIATIGVKESRRRGYEDSYTWVAYNEEIDEDETYYYVCLDNHDPITPDGSSFPMFKYKSLMDGCGIKEIADIQVFGVRKCRIKEIQGLENWIWIEDKLKEETAKISNTHVTSLVASEMLDSYQNRIYTNHNVAKMVGPDSDYAKYIAEYSAIKRANGNVTELVELCAKYGNVVHVDAVKNKIQNAKDALYKKYPLLKHMNSSVDNGDLAHYIKLVDKQEK